MQSYDYHLDPPDTPAECPCLELWADETTACPLHNPGPEPLPDWALCGD